MNRRRTLTVGDLPPRRPDRTLPDGSIVLARQPCLYCATCQGTYSANPGDYWAAEKTTPLRCCGRALRLVDEARTFQEVRL